jgi:hypothetical protein
VAVQRAAVASDVRWHTEVKSWSTWRKGRADMEVAAHSAGSAAGQPSDGWRSAGLVRCWSRRAGGAGLDEAMEPQRRTLRCSGRRGRGP